MPRDLYLPLDAGRAGVVLMAHERGVRGREGRVKISDAEIKALLRAGWFQGEICKKFITGDKRVRELARQVEAEITAPCAGVV